MLLPSGIGGAALFTVGAAQAWQQIQALQEEFNEIFEVLHEAPVTPMHTSGREDGGDENEEEQAQRAASRQMGRGRNQGFPAGSVFDPARFTDDMSYTLPDPQILESFLIFDESR